MKIRELTPEEFQSTTSENMRLLAENDHTCAGFPLVEYVERCIGVQEMAVEVEDVEFHYAYMNDDSQLCHVGLNFGDEDIYLVIVLDIADRSILGHTVIDISKMRKP